MWATQRKCGHVVSTSGTADPVDAHTAGSEFDTVEDDWSSTAGSRKTSAETVTFSSICLCRSPCVFFGHLLRVVGWSRMMPLHRRCSAGFAQAKYDVIVVRLFQFVCAPFRSRHEATVVLARPQQRCSASMACWGEVPARPTDRKAQDSSDSQKMCLTALPRERSFRYSSLVL